MGRGAGVQQDVRLVAQHVPLRLSEKHGLAIQLQIIVAQAVSLEVEYLVR